MAVAKVILNGETLMDVTSDTPSANNMLNGIIATKNDGTKVTGNITNNSSSDLTISGATVTAPAGYYANAASKAVSTTTHPNPSASITSSTGVVTASHTQTTGYVTSGTTTSTMTLTTQAAQTIYPSTADQTISSYRWLTGTQTIKSITTSNLTAANIAEGVVVKVGDSNNASRITQVTGTHSGATSYTATISGTGNSNYCYVTYSGTKYYSNNGTFTFKAGDTLTIYCRGNNASVNGDSVSLSSYSYTYTLPIGDITINLSYSSSTNNSIAIYGLVKPTGAYTISAAGTHNVYNYSQTTVATGSAFPPAVTITKNPTFSMNSATGVVTASYTGSSSITPTVTAGYISQGTAGTISTSGTSTYQLMTQAAQTIYPSTTDQTIASNRWLTGAQTIKSVTTSNLDASNIKSGVTVNVGDVNNVSRIAQVTGTYSSPKKYTATILSDSTGNASNCYVQLNGGTKYYTAGNTFEFEEGDTLYCYGRYSGGQFYISVNGEAVTSTGTTAMYTYTLPAKDIVIGLYYSSMGSIKIIESVIPTAYMAGQTFTPSKNGTTVYTTSKYLTGNIVINGDQNLVSENIAEGVSIFGVAGTHGGGEYYGIYKAIASGAGIYSNGSSTYSYTSTDVINWCNTWSTIKSNCFTGVYLNGSFNFPNVSRMIGPNFAYAPAWNLNSPGVYSINFPILTNIPSYAFYFNSGIRAINGNQVSTIGSNAFCDCRQLSSINFSPCTTIGESAFYYCTSLTTANFPSCTTIENGAFYYCISLATVSFPVCTTIGDAAFYSCSALTIASFPACTSIGHRAFYSCISLTTVNFPVCTTIGDAAFSSCMSLTTVSFPSCTTIGTYAFYNCRSLTTVSFPVCTTIVNYAFYGCISLTTVSFPSCTTIGNYAFNSCYNLLSLYLLGSSIVSLSGNTVFRSTPISDYTTSTGGVYGSIFVPASLYNSYKIATNWATYSARIVSV